MSGLVLVNGATLSTAARAISTISPDTAQVAKQILPETIRGITRNVAAGTASRNGVEGLISLGVF